MSGFQGFTYVTFKFGDLVSFFKLSFDLYMNEIGSYKILYSSKFLLLVCAYHNFRENEKLSIAKTA